MTQEQLLKAKNIEKQIASIQEKNEEIRKIKDRCMIITGEYDKYTKIQMAESWVSSPSAHIHVTSFLELLENEIKSNNLEIGRLEKEFSKL